jgi:hypothetical protein
LRCGIGIPVELEYPFVVHGTRRAREQRCDKSYDARDANKLSPAPGPTPELNGLHVNLPARRCSP